MNARKISKLLAAAAALVPVLVTQGLVSGSLAHILTGVLGFAVVCVTVFLAPKNQD
jgi:hypothetical protein